MPDYGLLGGLGQGLQAGFQAYMGERKHQEETRSNALAKALQAKLGGVQLNAAGTGYDDTPEKAEQGRVGLLKTTAEGQEYDPKSPHAGLLRNIAIQQIKSAHPDYSDEQVSKIVPEGLSASQYKEAAGLLKPELSGYYNMQGRKYQADTSRENARERNEIARGGLDLRSKNAANSINKEVMHDKVVQATDMQNNSIAKGLQQLNSKDKPITLQMLNEIQNDYANAITGGRQAAQGTIHDQQMQTLEGKAANLKQYITGNPAQAATPQQIAYFKTAFKELQGLNQGIRKQRVQTLTQGAQNAYGDQGAFGNVISNLNQNAGGESLAPQEITPEDQQAIAWAKANPKNPKALQILKLHGM